MKPKNILFIPKWYPVKDRLYHGLFIRRHAECAAVNNVVWVLYCVSAHQKSILEFEEKFEGNLNELRIYYKKNITGIGFIDKILKLFLYFRACYIGFKRIQKKTNIDLVHVHVNGRTGIFALFLKVFYNIKYIITEHWTGYFHEISWFKKQALKIGFSGAELSTFVSKPLQKVAITSLKLNIKSQVLANVLNQHYLDTPLIDYQMKDDVKLLCIADVEDSRKNYSAILNAIAILNDKNLKFNLDIIGDGSDIEKIRQLAHQLNIENKVKFLGEGDSKFIAKHINNADFTVLYSYFETFGIVVIESLALGKPVVLSDLEVFKSYVPDDFCVYAGYNDSDELAKGFLEMAEKVKRISPQEMREFVRENYSEESITKQLDQIYQSI